MAGTPATMYLDLPFLIILVSVIYSATRYDEWDQILLEAWRWGSRMAAFLGGIGLALYLLSRIF